MFIVIRFKLGMCGVGKVSLPLVGPSLFSLSPGIVGEFTQMHFLFSLTYLASNSERVLFFCFFKQWGRSHSRPRDLTAALNTVTFRIVNTTFWD